MQDRTAATLDATMREALRELEGMPVDEWLDELGAPSEFESLVWAARERGDLIAGRMADELARRAEFEGTAS